MSERSVNSSGEMIVWRVRRMNALINGLVIGFVCGLGVFLMTIWLVIKGGRVIGPHLALLGQYFIGYRVTFGGSFMGLLWGFVVGFIIAYLGSKLYNFFADLRQQRPAG